MTRLLSLFGLMRVSEHEQHKLRIANGYAARVEGLKQEIAELRPDALAMRRKRQMDRDRRKKS